MMGCDDLSLMIATDLEDGPGGDHDDEHQRHGAQRSHHTRCGLRLQTELDGPISHRGAQQHRESGEKHVS